MMLNSSHTLEQWKSSYYYYYWFDTVPALIVLSKGFHPPKTAVASKRDLAYSAFDFFAFFRFLALAQVPRQTKCQIRAVMRDGPAEILVSVAMCAY